MKRFILLVFLFGGTLMAQHSRQSLLRPSRSDYNLRGPVSQMIVTQHYDSGNDINFQETYTFDSLGNLQEYSKQGFGGRRVTVFPLMLDELQGATRHYSFDDDGDLLELRQFNLRGRLYATTHYIYAVGGNLIQTIEYNYDCDSGNVIKRTVSNFDKHSRLVSLQQYSVDELLLLSEKRRYDCRGNLVRRTQVFYNDDEKETTVERRQYNYDSHGNWVECYYSLNDKQMYIIRRQIVY